MVFYNSMHKNSFFNNHKIRFKNNNLRFSGFTDEWNEVKLGDISKSITKGTTPKKYSDTGINFVKVESIENNKIYKIDAFIDENTHKNELSRSILKTNDLLFSIAGSLGRTTIVTENILPANTNQALSIIRFYDNCNCNLNFIQSRLNTYDIAKYIFQNLAVGAQPNLNLQQVGNIKIRIPSFNEQNKIQGFLECVDIKIELLKKKYQQYQEFKKYLMQQIFTQKLRFDNSSKIQKEIQLSDVISIINKRNKNDENIPVLSISNKFGFISQTEQFEDREVASSDKKNYKIVNKGEFAYNPARINVGSIAQLKNYEKGIISPMYIVFKVDSNVLNQTYFENFLDSDYFRYEMMKRLEGSVRMILSADSLKNIKITIPSIDEQEKLSKVFLAFDKKIKITKYQLDKTQEFKKGLLQQMFVVQLILSLLQNKKHI